MSAPAHLPHRDGGLPSWPRLPASFIAAAAVLVAAAGAAGWLGRSLTVSTPAAPAAPQAVDLGPVTLSAPGTWAPARGPITGLPELGARMLAFAPSPGLSARAAITLAPFDDPTLVPAALRPLIGAEAPRRASLAGLPAWAYRPHEVAKGRMAQVTVAPTSAGSVTAVCIAPSAMWSAAAGCSDGLASATLEGATPLVPSASLAFRRELAPVLARLNARRAGLRAELRRSAARRGQARFATRLARVHVRAMRALTPTAAATGAPRRIVRELRRTARSYGRLSVAANKGWPGRYRQARVAIKRADRKLAAAIAAIR